MASKSSVVLAEDEESENMIEPLPVIVEEKQQQQQKQRNGDRRPDDHSNMSRQLQEERKSKLIVNDEIPQSCFQAANQRGHRRHNNDAERIDKDNRNEKDFSIKLNDDLDPEQAVEPAELRMNDDASPLIKMKSFFDIEQS